MNPGGGKTQERAAREGRWVVEEKMAKSFRIDGQAHVLEDMGWNAGVCGKPFLSLK